VEQTLAQQMLAAESVEAMYQVMLDAMDNDMEALLALTEEEITALYARVSLLDPEGDDTDTADLVDTLGMLPNSPQPCPDCGLIGEHAEDCPTVMMRTLDLDDPYSSATYSSYINPLMDGEYQGRLLSETGADVRTLDGATFHLFDYDPTAFNGSATAADRFVFLGNAALPSAANMGINDSSAGYANQGILKDSLVNGIPQMAFGTDIGAALFDPNVSHDGKTVYKNVGFEFVHNNGTYTYSSALNHAQFNKENNIVELYADTLSVINKKIVTADFTDPTIINGATRDIRVNVSNGKLTGTIDENFDDYNPDSEPLRIDPYFNVDVKNFTPNEGDRVYIRLKTSEDLSGARFQLFFNRSAKNSEPEALEGAAESRSFFARYPAATPGADGWYEYEIVIDTTDDSYGSADNWSTGDDPENPKEISQFRIDILDGNKEYDGDGCEFKIEEISVLGGTPPVKNNNRNGGFYPLSKISDSYPGPGDPFDVGAWGSSIGDANLGDYFALGSRAIYNIEQVDPAFEIANHEHLYLGLSGSIDFYMPASKKIDNKDIVYTFNGDDDLWVFIDGNLVLDVGGGHGAIKGTINLTTGDVAVSSAVTVTGISSGTGASGDVKTYNFLDKYGEGFCDAGDHTMQIFYMERAGSVSNCFMQFNLPLIPVGALEVEKQVSHGTLSPDPDEEFTFTLSGTDVNGEPINFDDIPYKLRPSSLYGETTFYPVNNQIKLKAGETAVFEEVAEQSNIIVTETPPKVESGFCKYDKTSVSVGSGAVEEVMSAAGTTSEGGQLQFVFTNYYVDNYFDLTIVKEGCDETLDPNQSFLFHVVCEDRGIDMYVDIVGNGEKTIKLLPSGTYTITEDTDWSWRYTLNENGQQEFVDGTDDKVTFTNVRTSTNWLDGNSWCGNLWGTDTITATKKPEETSP